MKSEIITLHLAGGQTLPRPDNLDTRLLFCLEKYKIIPARKKIVQNSGEMLLEDPLKLFSNPSFQGC